jgi:hypothetical protein
MNEPGRKEAGRRGVQPGPGRLSIKEVPSRCEVQT